MKDSQLIVGLIIILISIAFAAKPKSKPKKKVFFEGEFYLQKLYSGTNPMDNLKFSEKSMRKRHITLTPKILYFSKNAKEKRMIKEAIYLDDIVDKRADMVNIGKCCINIKYFNYSKRKKRIIKKKPFRSKKIKMILKQNDADFCLEVLAPEQARWRICSKTPLEIYRLHLKLVFAVIQSNMSPNTSQKVLIEKFLSNSLLAGEKMSLKWNWETQNQWGGQCKSSFMQSPLPIREDESLISLSQDILFSITYNLLETKVKILRRFNEIVITFLNDPGIFKIASGTNYILYRPVYISFRFPAEHVILGKRYDGELQIHCKELITDPKKIRTKGFILSVPLAVHENHINLDVLENLNIDLWKFEVKNSNTGSYTPFDYISILRSKKLKVFKLPQLMKNIVDMKSLYYFYLGSLNTPPCDEFVNHLVVGKPLQISNCQLKILRENTLATSSVKQVHVRLPKIEGKMQQKEKVRKVKIPKPKSKKKGKKKSKSKGKGKGKKKHSKHKEFVIDGSGNGKSNGFEGKRGVYVLGQLKVDPNVDLLIEKELRKKPLVRKKKRYLSLGDLNDNGLNC